MFCAQDLVNSYLITRLVTSNQSFSRGVFYHFGKLSTIFFNFKIVVCKLYQFGRVWNSFFWKGLSQADLLGSERCTCTFKMRLNGLRRILIAIFFDKAYIGLLITETKIKLLTLKPDTAPASNPSRNCPVFTRQRERKSVKQWSGKKKDHAW